MKSLLFILLAGYAARSDENNYYVIQMPDDPPIQTKKPFKVYWNVPTMQCASKKVPFENLYEKFGIIQNDDDRFKGEKVTILYDPGLFPALFKNETSGKFRFRNGGVPQEGDLEKHLDAFKKDLDLSVPDRDFSGIGIIDFESWRPIYRQNFGELRPYKDVSYEIERKLHWWWQKTWLEAEAKRRFEEAAHIFMKTTLTVAKQLRPNALWGFYGFPYCFNMASNNMVEACASHVPEENDRIHWLWSESTALYPSVYSSAKLSMSQLTSLIRGRIREAGRCGGDGKQILPYFWFRYRDAGFLSETDLNMALSTLYQSKATGFIIWGSSNDVNTVTKCNKLKNYVENVFGPAIAKYTKASNKINNENNKANATLNSNKNISTESPIFDDTTMLNAQIGVDLESEWDAPENFSQEVDSHREVGTNNTFRQNSTIENDGDTVLLNNSVLIDLILSNIANASIISSYSTDKNEKKDTLNYLDLPNSSTEVNINISTNATSQRTNTIVTNNPLFNEINNTIKQIVLRNLDTISSTITPKLDDTTTPEDSKSYKQTKIQTAATDESNGNLELDFTTISTSDFRESDTYETTEMGFYETYDDDEFFNFDTFNSEFIAISTTDSPITNLPTEQSKDYEKGHTKIGIQNVLINTEITRNDSVDDNTATVDTMETEQSEVDFADSTTEMSYKNPKNYTKDDIYTTNSSTDSIITTNVFSTNALTLTSEEPISIKTTILETSFINELSQTSTHKYEIPAVEITTVNENRVDSLILTTIPDLQVTNSQEHVKSTTGNENGVDNSILTTKPDLKVTNSQELETSHNNAPPNILIELNIDTTEEPQIPNVTETTYNALETSPKESDVSKTTKATEDSATSILPTTSNEQVVFNY